MADAGQNISISDEAEIHECRFIRLTPELERPAHLIALAERQLVRVEGKRKGLSITPQDSLSKLINKIKTECSLPPTAG